MSAEAHVSKSEFGRASRRAIHDDTLQQALDILRTGFGARRDAAAEKLPEFEALRDAGRDLKTHVLANLDQYLETWEARAQEHGTKVHWARDAAEARALVKRICAAAGARVVTKSKTMIAEEIGLNDFLADAGVEVVETDLGEYIVQIAGERPSHILAPAVHKTRAQIGDLFLEHHAPLGRTKRVTEPPEIVAEARAVLRDRYFDAQVGITGANFLVAETGSVVIVTNEGNADLTLGLPKVHIVLASLEKVVPGLDDVSLMLRLLARSATGQEMSSYTTVVTGPKRAGDADGPEQVHVILLDNGRSELLGSEFAEVLRCIRCGACMNVCPVYGAIGGHAYGWVYPGPIGAVLTPALIGIEHGGPLPNASTFCGRCEQVCPMRIPLPGLMRHWRRREFEQRLTPGRTRWALRGWAWLARRPRLYRLVAGAGVGTLGLLGRRRGKFRWLPFAGGWTAGRDLPAPEGPTFHALWAKRHD
jgi:L-lactate dehydrogenase complex protein LldF